MAEDFADKTEAPTPRRRQEAREQGQVARSPDLTAAVLVIGIMVMLDWYGPNLVAALKDLVAEMLGGRALSDHRPSSLGAVFLASVVRVATAMAPLAAGTLILAVLVNLAQVGVDGPVADQLDIVQAHHALAVPIDRGVA